MRRNQHLKYAISYLVVAAVLFISNHPAKNSMDGANQSQSSSNLHIDLSVARKLEPNPVDSNADGGGTYVVRFWLTNQGTQPIFYPATSDTNRPMSQIVYRVGPQSDWKPLSESEPSPSTHAQPNGRSVAG